MGEQKSKDTINTVANFNMIETLFSITRESIVCDTCVFIKLKRFEVDRDWIHH